MTADDKSKGLKSAYERALERLEADGIEPPRESALSAEVKESIAEARRVTEAKVAELEILHRDQLARVEDPAQRAEQEEFFQAEKARVLARGEAEVARLRERG